MEKLLMRTFPLEQQIDICWGTLMNDPSCNLKVIVPMGGLDFARQRKADGTTLQLKNIKSNPDVQDSVIKSFLVSAMINGQRMYLTVADDKLILDTNQAVLTMQTNPDGRFHIRTAKYQYISAHPHGHFETRDEPNAWEIFQFDSKNAILTHHTTCFSLCAQKQRVIHQAQGDLAFCIESV
jgi:hypothetical protein